MNAIAPIPSDSVGYVYCIRNDDAGAVKIGFSKSPHRRLAELQTASPSALRLISVIPAFFEYESVMHEMMQDRRLHGEWFKDTDHYASTLMAETSAVLASMGVTVQSVRAVASPATSSQPRTSSRAVFAHADALEAEGQFKSVA